MEFTSYVKFRVKSLHKVSQAYQYVVQNLTWSGVYFWSTLSNALLHKVLALVPLTATGPEVFVATMNKFLSIPYGDFWETLAHMNSLKLNSYPGENIKYFCAAILLDVEHIYISGDLNP